jgi:hypothetical protein
LPSTKIGPLQSFADGEVDRTRDARCNGIVTSLPPLRTKVMVPAFLAERASMFALIASDIRSPFSARGDTKAWSRGDDRPAVTRMAPSSLRSKWAT